MALSRVLLIAISGYVYFGGDPVPDDANNLVATPQNQSDQIMDESATPNRAGEMNLHETDTNPDEKSGTLPNENDLKEDLISMLELPALKNEMNAPHENSLGSRLENYINKQTKDKETTEALLETIIKPRVVTPTPVKSEKENTEDIFFKQLVSDLNYECLQLLNYSSLAFLKEY